MAFIPHGHGSHYNLKKHVQSLAHAIIEDDKEKAREVLAEIKREEIHQKYWDRIGFVLMLIVGTFIAFGMLITFFGVARG